MADLKISELTELTAPSGDDVLAIVSGGATRKITQQNARGTPQTVDESGVSIVNHVYVPGHIYRYGTNTTPGTTDMSTAVQTAIDVCDGNGGVVRLPQDDIYCASTLTIATGRFSIIGDSQRLAKIISGVIGASLFDITGSVTFLHMRDFRLEGNSLTGASGNGHAINFIDPGIGSGAKSPQQCTVERLTIDGFRGDDAEGQAGDFEACGIIDHDGLGNVYRDLNIANCGQGIYMRLSENCRIQNAIISACDVSGIMTYDCENVTIDGHDVINCGDGTGRTAPEAIDDFNIISMRDQNTVIKNGKVKNPNGTACIGIELSEGTIVQNNWIRPDLQRNGAHKGIYVERSPGTKITQNTFSAAVSGNTGDYEHIEAYHTQLAEPFANLTIEDNLFLNIGQDTNYCIRINGNAATRLYTNLRIVGNTAGQRASVATNTITDVIVIDATVNGCTIEDNTVVATTNTTVTDCLDINGTVTEFDLSKNQAITNGGTITNAWPESYTGTLTGCTTSPTGSIEYSAQGETVTLEVPEITGTSNTTAATITGMPDYLQPATAQTCLAITQDNGTSSLSRIVIETNGTITLNAGLSATFTASGTKGIGASTVTYRVR